MLPRSAADLAREERMRSGGAEHCRYWLWSELWSRHQSLHMAGLLGGMLTLSMNIEMRGGAPVVNDTGHMARNGVQPS